MPREDGQFKKGNAGKPKGAVSVVPAGVKEKFQQLLDGVSVEQLQEDLLKLSPKDRLFILLGLSEFLIPKLARTALTAEDPEGGQLTVTLHLNGPAKTDG